jgi:hypothetical protein
MKLNIFTFFLILSAQYLTAQENKPSKDLVLLASYLEGTYSSEEQSAGDTSYFNISLVIAPIWKSRNTGYWFYVEQALAKMKDKPYRQRVYHVTQKDDSTFESAIYNLANPLRFAGKTELVEALSSDSITQKEGCEVILRKSKENYFKGATDGKKCPSDLRGASYATSIVTLKEDELLSWDQGFDIEGKQVWGAVKGGYIFKKLK